MARDVVWVPGDAVRTGGEDDRGTLHCLGTVR
jgi:hypothetical protein